MGAPATPLVIDRYAVYGKIASGGMASVCFGRLLGGEGFARTVAIKRLHPHLAEDPEFRATLIDEARMAARIHHPNVVPTLDVVNSDGELLVVMEYVRGESLSRLLKIQRARRQRLPLPVVSAIVTGALHGLHAAHEATSDAGEPLGIVHRDVSPQNLLVGVDGLARVIDFGVAKAAGRLQTTRQGSIKGKVAYMAAEQVSGHDVTRAADIYSMGVVLWEILAGDRLFQGDNDVALVAKVLRGADEPPSSLAPGLPAGLDELVMRALALDPEDRFATAADMAARFVRIVRPALAVEVGKWVEEAARASLAQRGAELAEIEASSRISKIARQRPSAPPISGTGMRHGASAPVPEAPPTPVPTPVPLLAGAARASEPVDVQASSASTITPSHPIQVPRQPLGGFPVPDAAVAPRNPPGLRARGLNLAAIGLAALLGLGVAALWRGAAVPASSSPANEAPAAPPQSTVSARAATPPVDPTPAKPAASTTPTQAAPSRPLPPTVAATNLPVAPTPPPRAFVPAEPRPARAGRPPRPMPAPASEPGGPSEPTRSRPSCNPPYVIDSAGDRQYKPECL